MHRALFDAIYSAEDLYISSRCNEQKILDAQEEMGLQFAEEYLVFLRKYGYVSLLAREFGDLEETVDNTLFIQDEDSGFDVEPDMYVIESDGDFFTLQDKNGAVYETDTFNYEVKKRSDSFAEYLRLCIEEDERYEDEDVGSALFAVSCRRIKRNWREEQVRRSKRRSLTTLLQSLRHIDYRRTSTMREELLKAIDALANVKVLGGVSPRAIQKAEEDLGLHFAEDYREYLAKCGALAAEGMDLTGICDSRYFNVVEETAKERAWNPNFPANMYVIESLGIEGVVALQDESGAVYMFSHLSEKPEKECDSLADYLKTSVSCADSKVKERSFFKRGWKRFDPADESGRERAMRGLPPKTRSGDRLELHIIAGASSKVAELTEEEHRRMNHEGESMVIDRRVLCAYRMRYWKARIG